MTVLFTKAALAAEPSPTSIFIDFEDLPPSYSEPITDSQGTVVGYRLHYCHDTDPYAAGLGIGISSWICDVDFQFPGGYLAFEPASVTGASGYGIYGSGMSMLFNTVNNPSLEFVSRITFTATSAYRNWTRYNAGQTGGDSIDYSYLTASAVGGNTVTIAGANKAFVTLDANPGSYIGGVNVSISPAIPAEDNSVGALTMDNITIYLGPAAVDLAVNNVVLVQNGQVNPDPDGDGIVDLASGQPVTGTVTFSASKLGSLEPNISVRLCYESSCIDRIINLSSGSASAQVAFTPLGSGLQTLTASIQAAQGETNLANNVRTGQIRVRPQVKIVAEPIDGKLIENGPPKVVQVLPSLYACGRVAETLRRPRLQIKCVDEVSQQTVDGCSFRAYLEAGPYDGGHDTRHSEDRPLGTILPDISAWSPLPLTGNTVRFETPDVAGLVDLVVEGKLRSGEALSPVRIRYQIKTPDFEPISVSGLFFDVESHPSGNHGTNAMNKRVAKLVESYIKKAQTAGINNPPGLRSEGASLPWGGLFDIKKNWKHFPKGHCGHRDGRTLDLSLSIFNGHFAASALTTLLAEAIKDAGFAFTFAPESPDQQTDHWHIQLK